MSRSRSRATALVLAFGAVVAVSGCAASAAPESVTAERIAPIPTSSAELLFVARANTGDLTVGDTVTLRVNDLAFVTWFTDRPDRDSGVTTVDDALQTFGWSTSGGPIGDDPPNAVLTADELGSESVVLELATAVFDGPDVVFEVVSTGEAALTTMTLTNLELFIDSSTTTPGPFSYALSPQLAATVTLDGENVVVGVTSQGSVAWSITLSEANATGNSLPNEIPGVVVTEVTYTPAVGLSPGTVTLSATVDGQGSIRAQIASWQVNPG